MVILEVKVQKYQQTILSVKCYVMYVYNYYETKNEIMRPIICDVVIIHISL